MLMRAGLELVPLVYREVEAFHSKCLEASLKEGAGPPSIIWKKNGRGGEGLEKAAFRWINNNAPIAGLLSEHPDGDAWLVPIDVGDDILTKFESIPGVEMSQHDAMSMVLHRSLPENGEKPLTGKEVQTICLETVLFDCLPRTPWDTWRLYSEYPSRMVPHGDAQDCSNLATVLEIVASTPVIRDAAAALRRHCEAWNAKQPQDVHEVAAACSAVLGALGASAQPCHGLQGMAQNDFLEKFLALERSHQAFRCLGVLAGPRDTLQPHQLQLHAEAKRALFWHLDGISSGSSQKGSNTESKNKSIEELHASPEVLLQEISDLLQPVDTEESVAASKVFDKTPPATFVALCTHTD